MRGAAGLAGLTGILLFAGLATLAPAQTAVFQTNLVQAARTNDAFRRVLHTDKFIQTTLMSLTTGESIGMETHPTSDQVVLVVEGQVQVTVNGQTSQLGPGQLVTVPAGAAHDFRATGAPAKLVVHYAPPLHPANEVLQTKPVGGD